MYYLSYDDYKNIGGTVDEHIFNKNIERVNGIVDNATFQRIQNMKIIPRQVKSLCRDLIEYIASNNFTEKTITSKSQSAGNVSESESYSIKNADEQNQDIDNLICDYLLQVYDDNNIPLLYRG